MNLLLVNWWWQSSFPDVNPVFLLVPAESETAPVEEPIEEETQTGADINPGDNTSDPGNGSGSD